MPDSDPLPDQPEIAPEGEAQPSPPAFVPAEEFRSFQQTMQGSMSALTEALTSMRATMDMTAQQSRRREEEPRSAPEATVSRAQYVEAIQQGDVALVERYEAQQEAKIAARISQLEATGMNQFSQLNKRTETGGLEYYQRFQKEIDAMVESLPPQVRMQPGCYAYAHNAVVGQHAKELIAEAQEAALRKPTVAERPESLTGRGRSGREAGKDATAVPSAYDLGGEAAEQALQMRGMTQDDQARKMGYADWKDYMTKVAEYR